MGNKKLEQLNPIDAVKTWLDCDFCMGDEPHLITAIRKDSRIVISDDSIIDVICDAMDENLSPEGCLEALASNN